MSKSMNGSSARPRRKKKTYSEAMKRKVIEALARGKTYADFDRMSGLPCTATIYNWRKAHPDFAAMADDARAFGAEACADRALEVAEQATEDTVRKAKLHVDALMQRAAHLAPERWGGGRSARSAAKAEPVEIVFRIRQFEKVIGPDGKAFVREVLPEGEN